MTTKRLVFAVVVAGALSAIGCVQPGGRGPVVVPEEINRAGKFIVCVVDASGSMNDNDPSRYSVQGPQLAVAIAGPEDNFGAVAFNVDAWVVTPLRSLSNISLRSQAQQELDGIRRFFGTNYVAALRLAMQMLSTADAPRGSAVVFLSDGKHKVFSPPGGSAEDVLALADRFADRGWKIHTIGLGREAESERLLMQIAVRTGGRFSPVAQPEALLEAFLKTFQEIQDFFAFSGKELPPVLLFPGTKRLVCAITKSNRRASLVSLERVGATEKKEVYKFPREPNSKVSFEAIMVPSPEPGVWTPKIEGEIGTGVILQQVPFTLSLGDGTPGTEYYEGESIEISLLVHADSPDVLGQFVESVAGKAELVSQGNGKEKPVVIELTTGAKAGREGKILRFSGSIPAKLSAGGEAENYTLKAWCTLKQAGEEGARWAHEKVRTLRVLPGERPAFVSVAPSPVEIGAMWKDDEPRSVQLDVMSKVPQAIDLRLIRPQNEAVQVAPLELTVRSTETSYIALTVNPSLTAAGEYKEKVMMRGRFSSSGGQVPEASVDVIFSVHSITGLPESIEMGEFAPGEKFEVPLEAKVTPGVPIKFELGELDAVGPVLEVVEKEGGPAIAGEIAEGTVTGSYETTLAVTFPDTALAPKTVAVKFGCRLPPAEFVVDPATLHLVAKEKGQILGKIEFNFKFAYGAELKVELSDLVPKAGTASASWRISKQLGDITAASADREKWDGHTLEAGGHYSLDYGAYVYPDLPNGAYEGTVTLTADYHGEIVGKLEVPVVLEVVRSVR